MIDNGNIPILRFNEFQKPWKLIKLKELTSRVKLKNNKNNTNVLTISSKYGLISQLEYFNKSVSAKNISGYYLLKRNDFAYNKSYSKGYPMGAIKKLNRYDSGVVSTLYICFRSNNQLDSQFAEKYFDSGIQNEELYKVAQEGARNHGLLNIGLNDFFDIRLKIPEIDEQKKVANFIEFFDKRLDCLREKELLLHEYKKCLLQKIFSQEIRFKKDNGDPFSEWQNQIIGDLFSSRSEKTTEVLELLSVTIGNGVCKQSEISKNDSSSRDKSNYKRVYKNDIAYNSMRMWQGSLGVSDYDGIVSPAYTILEPKKNCCPKFFEYYFKTVTMLRKFQRNSQGLTSDTWNLKYPQLSKIKISVPVIEEQIKIADFLSAIDKNIALVNTKIEQTKTYKKGLLQQLFV